ncbi:MAG TPA: TetR/AcrR family transcriptional regulator [Gemmatimonadales bacterium]|nr:TetR/AcrR family transcriptional regulator [Gemmatimonadales bacterium]
MTDSTPHRDGARTRERLVRAAMELFTTTGFLGATTPTIAERAGVAEGTIYRHFKSKEELLNEIYRQALRWGIEALAASELNRPRDASSRLQHFARRITETAALEPGLIRMLLSTVHGPFLDERSQVARRTFVTALAQVVAAGKSDGQIRSGPAELWAQVWMAVVTFAAERVASGEWAPESAPVGLTIEAAWDAIATRPSLPSPGGVGGGAGRGGGTSEDREVSKMG